MIHVDTEPHGTGYRWYLVNTATGERLDTGRLAYTDEMRAHAVGVRQKTALMTEHHL